MDEFGQPLSRAVPDYKVAPLVGNPDPITERVIDFDGGFQIERTQTCDDTIAGVHAAGSLLRKKTKGDGARYLGSAPLIVAEIWAKECGASIGSREFAEYAHKKLLDGEFARLKVHLT